VKRESTYALPGQVRVGNGNELEQGGAHGTFTRHDGLAGCTVRCRVGNWLRWLVEWSLLHCTGEQAVGDMVGLWRRKHRCLSEEDRSDGVGAFLLRTAGARCVSCICRLVVTVASNVLFASFHFMCICTCHLSSCSSDMKIVVTALCSLLGFVVYASAMWTCVYPSLGVHRRRHTCQR
jgi:hypothetical protein